MQCFKQSPGIYKIENSVTKKVYIGSSINVSVRITAHKVSLKGNRHGNIHLQRSFNKHGIEFFNFVILEYCEESELITKEEYYINLCKSNKNKYGYNIASFEQGRRLHSEKTKLKISSANKGRKKTFSPEWCLNISKSNQGRKASETQKKNIRKCKIGVKRDEFSDEWKKNLSNSRRKFLFSISKDGILIKEKLTNTEACLFLNVASIYTALKMNYKVKGYTVNKISYTN